MAFDRFAVSVAISLIAGCGRIDFDIDAAATRADASVDAAPDCAAVAGPGCFVVPCAAFSGCLIYCSGQLTWSEAASDCETHGAQLACAETVAQRDCIVAARGSAPNTWLGFSQGPGATLPQDSWTWSCTGDSLDDLLWNAGEPNDAVVPEDGQEQCGILDILGSYNDVTCGAGADWACEAP